MKKAQQLYDYIKKKSPAHEHQMAAMKLAYEHIFGKGYNPEVMDDLWLMLRGVSTLDWLLSAEYIAAIKSILEKAKLK